MSDQTTTEEEALKILMTTKDDAVKRLARDYINHLNRRAVAEPHWNNLDHALAALKRAFR